MQRYHLLTELEKHVLLKAGTERPFSGQYSDFEDPGIYLCKQCDLPLFSAKDKFACSCGWPSFDEKLPEAIYYLQDPDGRRTEVRCSRCSGHLGHVFTGEHLTKKNRRYCINSLALQFNAAFLGENLQRAIYAAGCFWGVEHLLNTLPGVVNTKAGYIGGWVVEPTYEEVCSEKTGHLEAVEVVFDPRELSYEKLTKRFFSLHDPEQTTGQGPDIGPQYLSCIFFLTEKQEKTAENLIHILEKKGKKVATKLQPASRFYPAEKYHQQYYKKNGQTPYCHRFSSDFW